MLGEGFCNTISIDVININPCLDFTNEIHMKNMDVSVHIDMC